MNFASIKKIWDKMNPPLYYATDEFIARGRIVHVDKSIQHPEYIIFHPDDFNEIDRSISRKLISINEYHDS